MTSRELFPACMNDRLMCWQRQQGLMCCKLDVLSRRNSNKSGANRLSRHVAMWRVKHVARANARARVSPCRAFNALSCAPALCAANAQQRASSGGQLVEFEKAGKHLEALLLCCVLAPSSRHVTSSVCRNTSSVCQNTTSSLMCVEHTSSSNTSIIA